MALHIRDLNIDKKLQACSSEVVHEIPRLEMKDGKVRNFYSFATKYCHFHSMDDYPMYDYHVSKLLVHYQIMKPELSGVGAQCRPSGLS